MSPVLNFSTKPAGAVASLTRFYQIQPHRSRLSPAASETPPR